MYKFRNASLWRGCCIVDLIFVFKIFHSIFFKYVYFLIMLIFTLILFQKILEAKREKLREQHEDAKRLKENIDRRSNQVSTFLHKYLTVDEYADYDRFMKLKTKLIVDIRELDEKINLGEEQLAALSVVAHLWKSANS